MKTYLTEYIQIIELNFDAYAIYYHHLIMRNANEKTANFFKQIAVETHS